MFEEVGLLCVQNVFEAVVGTDQVRNHMLVSVSQNFFFYSVINVEAEQATVFVPGKYLSLV
jgi:hypothetical protein